MHVHNISPLKALKKNCNFNLVGLFSPLLDKQRYNPNEENKKSSTNDNTNDKIY